MGVSLTLVANGDTMTSSIQRTNIDAVVTWLNGGITTGDLTKASLSSRHVRKMDHVVAPDRRSLGISGTVASVFVDDAPVHRALVTADSHGKEQWQTIPSFAKRLYIPITGTVEVCANVWVWITQSANTTPEVGEYAWLRLAVEGVELPGTRRKVLDAGTSAAPEPQFPPYEAATKVPTMVGYIGVVAGNYLDFSVQEYVVAQTRTQVDPRPSSSSTGVNYYGLHNHGARGLTVEYYAK